MSDDMFLEVPIERWCGQKGNADRDAVVVEEPLEIRVNDTPLAVTMRTPGQDDALAVGYLVTEGILTDPSSLFDVTRCGDPLHPQARNIINVYVEPELVTSEHMAGRQRYSTSSCGLCGAATIEMVRKIAPLITRRPRLSRSVLSSLPDMLRCGQDVFGRTGGLHAAGLFDPAGAPVAIEEDVGRHNAVDKAVGRAFLMGHWPLDSALLMASGRAGFEIVQKALVAHIPVVCSVSAPSSLAVQLARDAGIVLVGFLRGDRFNVYAGQESVVP